MKNPLQISEASPAMWYQRLLPATRHRWMRPVALTTARLADTRFTYLTGMEGWVALGGWLLYTYTVYLPVHGQSTIQILCHITPLSQ